MTITASMVKELRERTGAGMMACKEALKETSGDIEQAIKVLRERGEAKAAKRAGKTAAEGTVMTKVSDDNKSAFIVEINSETDFVARDENFQTFAKTVTVAGLQNQVSDLATLLTIQLQDNTIDAKRQALVAKIGENVQVRRCALLKNAHYITEYNHGGRIAVIIAIDKALPELARDIAMHIAASHPLAIDEHGISKDIIATEREIFTKQAAESGKPADIIEKMVAGRMNKFYKENTLLNQPFVKNPDQTVADLLKASGSKVESFVRFEVGEGIEKERVDFAKEVQEQINSSK